MREERRVLCVCPRYREFDHLHVGELGDATDALIVRLAHDPSRPDRQIVFTTGGRRDLAAYPIPAHELAERDRLLACGGISGPIDVVDDNFIGNRRAIRELLPVLIDWQKRRGYPLMFDCEATLNLAARPDILELMRQARFATVFCKIETPEPEALKAMAKGHNMLVPILEGIDSLNRHGLGAVSGIIVGLDTDTPDTDFRGPYEQVLDIWRDTMTRACRPDAVFARYHHQLTHTFPFRLDVPAALRDIPRRKPMRGLRMLLAVLWHCGVRADDRRHFWKLGRHCQKNGQIDVIIRVANMAHHLIVSARDASAGRQKASHCTARPQTALEAAE